MKRLGGVLFLLSLFLLPLACGGKKAKNSDMESLKKSRVKWEALKENCKGNYSYKIRQNVIFGYRSEFETVVKNNRVVCRRFFSYDESSWSERQGGRNGLKWEECGEELGSHGGTEALKTMDELYDEAGEILKKTVNGYYRLCLDFNEKGVLKDCCYIDTRVMEDITYVECEGVEVLSLKPGLQ